MNNTATYSRGLSTSQMYRSYSRNMTPMSVTSNFYESTRPLQYQQTKHNMPIELTGNMLRWNNSDHPANWDTLISRTNGAYTPARGSVMVSQKRLKESEQSVRTLQPHLQQPPKVPLRKPISPSNKENKSNLLAGKNTDNYQTKKITNCARVHNSKIYKSDVCYAYPAEEVQKATVFHRPLRRQSCKPEIETSEVNYIGNPGDLMMKDSATSLRSGDYKSSIVGLPGSDIRPFAQRNGSLASRANRQLETTYEKFQGNPPVTYERGRSAKARPRTASQNPTQQEGRQRSSKRIFENTLKGESVFTKQSEELKIPQKMQRPQGVRSAFASTICFS